MSASALLRADTQLNRRSYYEASAQRPPAQPPLHGDSRADVVVVGAGYAGLSAAIELAQRGLQVVVLEADRVCSGASGRNGGQAIVGVACGQDRLEAELGRTDARLAWDMALEGVRLIDERIAAHGIDCDRRHGYLYVADSPRQARALLRDIEAQQAHYGLACETATGAAVRGYIDSARYHAAAYESVSGHLHPLRYGLGLARAAQALGVRLHEGTAAQTLEQGADGVTVRTAGGRVQAGWALLAGNCTLADHGPALAPRLRARIMPVGTYIAATAPLPAATAARLIAREAAVCDNNFVLDYFRFSADHRLLFGGRVSYSTLTPPRLQPAMAARIAQVFPELRGVPIDYLWGGFVDISRSRAPDFGRLGSRVFYLQGFSGHGVALTGLAGRLVAEAIAGQAGRFDVWARLRHSDFPGGARWRTPTLALGMLWYRLRDALG